MLQVTKKVLYAPLFSYFKPILHFRDLKALMVRVMTRNDKFMTRDENLDISKNRNLRICKKCKQKNAPGSRFGLARNKTFGHNFIDPHLIQSEVIN